MSKIVSNTRRVIDLLKNEDGLFYFLNRNKKTIFISASEKSCPLAQYLKVRGVINPTVNDGTVEFYNKPANKRNTIDLPDWASDFVLNFDSLDGSRLTGKRILESNIF